MPTVLTKLMASKNRETRERVMGAMLEMVKLDVAKLEAAAKAKPAGKKR